MQVAKRTGRFCTVALAALAIAVCGAAQNADQPAGPTVNQIIDHYVAAIGGRAAIQKQTSRASMGTIDVPAMHLSGTVMIHEKAPDKVLQVVIFSGNVFRQGFDGTTGWTDDPADGMRVLSGPELAEVRRDADFFHPLHLHEIYPKLAFAGTEKIGESDAYVLEGTTPEETDSDKMYFDEQSGLILRVINHRHTADGDAQIQEDFQDYRTVDGMKLPFTIIQTGGSADFTIRIGQVRGGVNLEDSEFTQPQPVQN